MTSRADATAAPICRTIDGKEYKFSPLCDGDYGEFEQFLQDREMAIAKRNVEGLPVELAKEVLKHAHDRAAQMEFAGPGFAAAMRTVAGGLKIIHLSLLHKQPNMTLEDVAKLVSDPGVFADLVEDVPLGLPDIAAPKKKRAVKKTPKAKVRKARKAERKRKKK